jgi:hypothetical protein
MHVIILSLPLLFVEANLMQKLKFILESDDEAKISQVSVDAFQLFANSKLSSNVRQSICVQYSTILMVKKSLFVKYSVVRMIDFQKNFNCNPNAILLPILYLKNEVAQLGPFGCKFLSENSLNKIISNLAFK